MDGVFGIVGFLMNRIQLFEREREPPWPPNRM